MFPGITFKWRVHERWSRECFLFFVQILRIFKPHGGRFFLRSLIFTYHSGVFQLYETAFIAQN